MSLLSSHRGFSSLTAIGVTGFLMILALGLTQLFMMESRINRSYYEGILLSNATEGAFEYARLKMVNHRHGFSDTVGDAEIDSRLLAGSLPQTADLQIGYEMETQSVDRTFSVAAADFLVIPLFVGDDTPLVSGQRSKRPNTNTGILSVTGGLSVSGLDASTTWAISGMSGGTTISRVGTGVITPASIGTTRLHAQECYGLVGSDIGKVPCDGPPSTILEVQDYLYDQTGSVAAFLSSGITEPVLSIYNNSSSTLSVSVTSSTPYSLPIAELTTTAHIGQSSRSMQFTEDKSIAFKALNY